MAGISYWIILGLVSIALLMVYWRKRNAVWGGLTAGVIVGLIIAIIYFIKGSGFIWVIIGKSAILGVLAGFFAELLGIISSNIKNKQ